MTATSMPNWAIFSSTMVCGLIEAEGMPPPALIINRLRPKMVRVGEMMAIEDIVELLSVPLLGFIPEGEDIVISTNEGKPVVHNDKSKTGAAFRRIAARIDGQDVPFEPLDDDNGLLSRLKRFFK